MKTLCTSLRVTLIAFVCLLTSCTDDVLRNHQAAVLDDFSDEAARKKMAPVSVFSVNDRDYDFIYDDSGRLSSIIVTSGGDLMYQYIVHYKGDQFVGADLVENGEVVSSNTNFEFDKKGRILAYDYVFFYVPEFPEGITEHNTLMYDQKGNLVGMNGVEFLGYDPHRNIVLWHDDSFEYDHKTSNPLNSIPNLWLVFVEEFGYAQLILSADLSTSKTITNVSSTSTTTYTHQYNSAGQLISKVGTTNGVVTERYTFSY
jgi:hypothetical protein